MVNPDVAEHTRLNLTVPLLSAIALLMIRRVNEPVEQAAFAATVVLPESRLAA